MNIESFKKHLIWAEGYEKKPYKDSVGKWTIGVGRNLDDRGLSDDEIDYLLSNDIKLALKEAEKLPYFGRLDPVRQLVVCDLVFNMGLPTFKKFVKTNLALDRGDYAEAARELTDSKWYVQTGRRARKLVEMMREGLEKATP